MWLKRIFSIGPHRRHPQLPVPLGFVLSHVWSMSKSQETMIIQTYSAYQSSSTVPFAPHSTTEAMHGSSLTLRPRQRTSTSCTECRSTYSPFPSVLSEGHLKVTRKSYYWVASHESMGLPTLFRTSIANSEVLNRTKAKGMNLWNAIFDNLTKAHFWCSAIKRKIVHATIVLGDIRRWRALMKVQG